MSQPAQPRRPSVLVGMFRIARGRADGLQFFGNTPQAFMTSLAPMAGLLLAGLFEGLAAGDGSGAVADLLPAVCALLAPPVLSNTLARMWGREAEWLRFATAMNWCQLLLLLVLPVLLLMLGITEELGVQRDVAYSVFLVGLCGYALWLHWFLARHGLMLSGRRAALLVVGVNLGTALMVLGPRLLAAGQE